MMQRYDVVVVGGGSAGCVLAARLSERADRTVLLLEAGPDSETGLEPNSVTGPSFFDALDEPGRTWPELLAERVSGGPLTRYWRGRGTGGSSAVNAMIAMIAAPEDYDCWDHQHGCRGWGWADLQPALERVSVPLMTTPPEEQGDVGRALIDAAGADWRAGSAVLTRWPDGARASAASAYLTPARGRQNLTVRGDSLVDRVLFDGTRAIGVVLADAIEIEADEVILAAGAIHSPAILLRSGVDRPGVGGNLCEHASCSVGVELRHPGDPHGLAVTTLAHRDDVQLLALDHVGASAPGWGAFALSLMRTRSRGTVTLASADPTVDPVVRLNLLDHHDDRASMVAGVAWLREVLDHPAVAAVSTGLYLDDQGTPWSALGDTPEAVEAWLRTSTGDYVHAAGTCRMGRADDLNAVVDPDGRVIGSQQLRVCDASIFPELPAANPHLTVLAAAELVASRMG